MFINSAFSISKDPHWSLIKWASLKPKKKNPLLFNKKKCDVFFLQNQQKCFMKTWISHQVHEKHLVCALEKEKYQVPDNEMSSLLPWEHAMCETSKVNTNCHQDVPLTAHRHSSIAHEKQLVFASERGGCTQIRRSLYEGSWLALLKQWGFSWWESVATLSSFPWSNSVHGAYLIEHHYGIVSRPTILLAHDWCSVWKASCICVKRKEECRLEKLFSS